MSKNGFWYLIYNYRFFEYKNQKRCKIWTFVNILKNNKIKNGKLEV